jgi:hypothetical protein
MRNKKTVIKETTNVDQSTGEILDRNFVATKWNAEPDFVKLYIADLSLLFELSKTADKALFALIRKMNYDNEIVLTSYMKNEMAEMLKMKKNTLEHCIGELCLSGIFLKKGNNMYFVNPKLFGKGAWSEISKIRMTVEYSVHGKMVGTTVSRQPELPNLFPKKEQ